MELNVLVTLERGHLNWFRYPTHNIGTYLGRGVSRAPEALKSFDNDNHLGVVALGGRHCLVAYRIEGWGDVVFPHLRKVAASELGTGGQTWVID